MERLILEGGARFAEDIIQDGFDRYADDALGLFNRPGTSLADRRDHTEGEVGAGYASGLFWKYAGEQLGQDIDERGNGIDVLRAVLEEGSDETRAALLSAEAKAVGPYHVSVMRRAIAGLGGTFVAQSEAVPSTTQGIAFDWLAHDQAAATRPRPSQSNELGRVVFSDETLFGNFAVALALNGRAARDSRFRFRDARNPSNRLENVTLRIPPQRMLRLSTIPEDPSGTTDLGATWARAPLLDRMVLQLLGSRPRRDGLETLPPYSVIAFEVRVDIGRVAPPPRVSGSNSAPRDQSAAPKEDEEEDSILGGATGNASRNPQMLRIRLSPRPHAQRRANALQDALIQVLLLDEHDQLMDIIRHDCQPVGQNAWDAGRTEGLSGAMGEGRAMDLTIDTSRAGRILILVCAREQAGDFSLRLSRVRDRPLIVSTPWNAREFTQYSADPNLFARTWRSPSIGIAGDSLYVEVRNMGDVMARDVTASFWYRIIPPRRTGGDVSVPGMQGTGWTSIGTSRAKDIPPVSLLRNTAVLLDRTSTHPDSRWQLQVPLPSAIKDTLLRVSQPGQNSGVIVRARIDCRQDNNNDSRNDILSVFGNESPLLHRHTVRSMAPPEALGVRAAPPARPRPDRPTQVPRGGNPPRGRAPVRDLDDPRQQRLAPNLRSLTGPRPKLGRQDADR
jgi:hypothetical protein